MLLQRTWDVSLDGRNHVITYTVPGANNEMSGFAVDGAKVAVDWRPIPSDSDTSVSRTEFDLSGHQGAFIWRVRRPAKGIWILVDLVRLLVALGGQANSHVEPETAAPDIWLTVDDVVIPERP